MTNLALPASLALSLLCTSAVAQSSSPPPRTPSTTARSVPVTVGVRVGNDHRAYDLIVELDRCGRVEAHDADRRDEIEVCAEARPQGYGIRAKWKLRAGAIGYETDWSAVVAPGQTVDVGRAGGPRFTLKAM